MTVFTYHAGFVPGSYRVAIDGVEIGTVNKMGQRYWEAKGHWYMPTSYAGATRKQAVEALYCSWLGKSSKRV